MPKLRNTYFVMRHGESKANVAEIIVSHLEDGKSEDYTLTTKGEEQAHISAHTARKKELLGSKTIIYSSPLSRCRKTAEIAKEELQVHTPIILDDRLRERFFGDWEKMHNAHYQKVWDIDKTDPSHRNWATESANDVLQRMLDLISEIEKTSTGKTILIVSHGDPLQILIAGINGASAATHRDVVHLQTAEIRKL